MKIQFGTLLNVYGTPATHSGYIFVPADVELLGNGFSSEFHLHAISDLPPELRKPIAAQYDAAWVRARLPRVFGFTPFPAEIEKSLLDVGFVAAQAGSSYAIPFVCGDHYGQTGLTFSPDGPDQASKIAIASAFWGLMLQAPDDLENFESKVYHSGAGIWLHYECRDGELTCSESED